MHRQREWDEVVTVALPAVPGGDVHLVVLSRERILVEEARPGLDTAALVAGLRTPVPYRAWAVPRSDGTWGVAARRIDVIELHADPGGEQIELVWDGVERVVRIDGEEVAGSCGELEELGRQRFDTFVVVASRLDGRLWELDVVPL